MKTKLTIVRHGETDWNAAGKIQGHTDIPLNEKGRGQAHALAEKFAKIPFTRCYSSDLKRASETAQIIYSPHQLPVLTDHRLRERYFASWEGKQGSILTPIFQEAKDIEQDAAVSQRLWEILHEAATTHKSEHILIVSHGGVFPFLFKERGTARIMVDNTAYITMIYEEDFIEDMVGVSLFPKLQSVPEN